MKSIILLTILLIGCIVAATMIYPKTSYSNIRRGKTLPTYNRVIKSTYDVKHNIYAVLYVENNDTLGLDWITPYELDSLINDLNQNNNEKYISNNN